MANDDSSQYIVQDFDLHRLVRRLWARRFRVLGITLAFAVIATAYAFLATEIFRSQAVVLPTQDYGSANALGRVASQLGGLADIAGVSFTVDTDREVALATLSSRVLIEQFIDDHKLLPKLYKSDWDAARGEWKTKDVPTLWQAYKDFTDDVLRVSDDKKTGLVTVSIEWENPLEAQQWVSELIARTNLRLKSIAITEGERRLAYLQEQSKKLGQVEIQQSVFALVESELKKLMVAQGQDEYALRTVDPADLPTKRAWPKRAIIIAVATVLGFLVGAATVLLGGTPTVADVK